MLHFIADLAERLPAINRSFVADPRRTRGSMFRIYRCTRFLEGEEPVQVRRRSAVPAPGPADPRRRLWSSSPARSTSAADVRSR
jgi:uncharacterized protein (DUF2461 family)